MKQNNVTRLLKNRGVEFELFELPAVKRSGLETANLLGVRPELIFKTLVTIRAGPGKPILSVIPADHELDLKAAARAIGEKKVILASQKEAERLTRLQTGGISPLALIHLRFLVVIDRSALKHDTIYVSGGQRDLIVRLPPQALVSLTKASVNLIVNPPANFK